MSFGPSSGEKSATQQQQQVTSQAQGNSAMELGKASGLLNQGGATLAPATNFFNTLLNGNQANTTAMLQPDIDRIRAANQGTLQAISTLMPRGGGRAGALFSQPFAANQGIQSLFNGARSGAAGQLAGIGLQQQGLGTNLMGIGNQPLNTALTGTQDLFGNAFQQRQYQNQQQAALAKGILGLALMPVTGGLSGTLAGSLGGLFGGGGINDQGLYKGETL